MRTLFNEIVDCAYGEAICYAMSAYYAHHINLKLHKLCEFLEEKYPFAEFSYDFMDFTCEFKIILHVGKISSKQLDKVAADLPGMKMEIAGKHRVEFCIDDEGYFEDNFINPGHNQTGESLIKKYGLKVIK